MAISKKKQIPVLEDAWTIPSSSGEEPQLIGSECPSCGEIFFPKKGKGMCTHCQHQGLSDIKLSRRGKIASFTIAMQSPGGGFYKGPVPYSYGCVDLPEGVRVETLFTRCDFDELQVGMDVELVIEKLCEDDEGNEVMTYKFKPTSS